MTEFQENLNNELIETVTGETTETSTGTSIGTNEDEMNENGETVEEKMEEKTAKDFQKETGMTKAAFYRKMEIVKKYYDENQLKTSTNKLTTLAQTEILKVKEMGKSEYEKQKQENGMMPKSNKKKQKQTNNDGDGGEIVVFDDYNDGEVQLYDEPQEIETITPKEMVDNFTRKAKEMMETSYQTNDDIEKLRKNTEMMQETDWYLLEKKAQLDGKMAAEKYEKVKQKSFLETWQNLQKQKWNDLEKDGNQ